MQTWSLSLVAADAAVYLQALSDLNREQYLDQLPERFKYLQCLVIAAINLRYYIRRDYEMKLRNCLNKIFEISKNS